MQLRIFLNPQQTYSSENTSGFNSSRSVAYVE